MARGNSHTSQRQVLSVVWSLCGHVKSLISPAFQMHGPVQLSNECPQLASNAQPVVGHPSWFCQVKKERDTAIAESPASY